MSEEVARWEREATQVEATSCSSETWGSYWRWYVIITLQLDIPANADLLDGRLDAEATNEVLWKNAQGLMVECEHCGRKFNVSQTC